MEDLWEVTNALSNGTIPDHLLHAPPFPSFYVRNPHTELQLLMLQLLSSQVKLRTSNLVDAFTGVIRTKRIKISEKRERGRIQGLSKYFGYPPLLSQERVEF